VYDIIVKKIKFAISSVDELLVSRVTTSETETKIKKFSC